MNRFEKKLKRISRAENYFISFMIISALIFTISSAIEQEFILGMSIGILVFSCFSLLFLFHQTDKVFEEWWEDIDQRFNRTKKIMEKYNGKR